MNISKSARPAMMRHVHFALIATIAAFSAVRAQGAALLRVRVTDADGTPLWGATVSVKADTARFWSSGILTDSTGRYARQLPAGTHYVLVSARGFRQVRDTLAVRAGDTVIHGLALVRTPWTAIQSIRFGGPQRVAYGAGPAYLVDDGLGPRASSENHGLVFAALEPGYRAGRLSAGYLAVRGNMGSGWSVRGSVLQKWNGSRGTFIGPEVSGMLFAFLGPRIGLFQRIGGGTGGLFVFVDFGIGG